MIAYVKYRNVCAISFEWSKDLGIWPFFKFNTCKGETVIDIPYGQIIITPRAKLLAEKKRQAHDYEQRDQKLPPAPPGATEN